MWTCAPDDAEQHLQQARELFAAWATEATGDVPQLSDGPTVVTLQRLRMPERQPYTVERSVSVRAVEDNEGAHGFEGTTRETSAGMTWTTIVRVVAVAGGTHVWVENQAESERLVGVRLAVGRPRIVDDLLAACPSARLGGSGLMVEPQPIPSGAVPILVEHLQSPDRTLPVIVVSQPNNDDGDPGAWLRRASRIARRVSGVATVATLDRAAVVAFSSELGPLATWDGSIRVYSPVPVADGEGYRHRYTLRHLLEDEASERAQVDRIVYGVCALSTRRRPPAELDIFATPVAAVDLSNFMSIDDADGLIRELQSQLDAVQEDANETVEEHDALARDLSMKVGHLSRLQKALNEQGLHNLFYETQHDLGAGIPDEADSVETAIILAMDWLSDWLVIHDDAPQALDGINTSAKAGAWGNTTWRGFRALAAFAETRDGGGGFAGTFYDWCKSDPPLGWPATPKKLSMAESDTVQKNAVLSAKRVLPVSTEVDPEGSVLMLAHLKIAEGGGNLAPRVYFYDDTAGPTKKVHVGFVGPHHLMPNTRS